MAQVQITRRNGIPVREYKIDPGDTLSSICFKYGITNWNSVYDSPENAAFKQQFPDPDAITPLNAPPLFIPLVGANSGGVKLRGAAIKTFVGAHIMNPSGAKLSGIKLRLVVKGAPHEGIERVTNNIGDVILTNPPGGDVYLASAEFELVELSKATSSIPPVDVSATSGPLPHPTPDFKLMPNQISTVVARRALYVVCPMCGVTFKTLKPPTTAPENLCPNDGFDLTTIEAAIESDFKSFWDPKPQNPKSTPTALKCRGTRGLVTAHGIATVYWDESRFVLPDQGNYALSGKKVSITGRATWGAAAPIFTPNADGTERKYEFHFTTLGETSEYPYNSMGIPSNETVPLASVLKWITIHHSVTPKTALAVQNEHQNVGLSNDPNNKAADVGYHFIITDDGTIHEGRPLGIKGSHAEFFNGGNIGIVLCGDFERLVIGDDPTVAALKSLDELVDALTTRFPDVKSVWSHQERKKQANLSVPTACPGKRLIPHVDALHKKFPGPPP